MTRSFWKVGHLPTLIAAFLYFDISFLVWVILGPLAVQIGDEFGLGAAQKGLMVAVPSLAGAGLRILCGVLVDRFGPKRVGLCIQIIAIIGLAVAWAVKIQTFGGLISLGIALGFAGASFVVAMPLASHWYPPTYQGTALGITGAGNSGTVLAAMFAPALAAAYGWRNVLGLCVLPLILVLLIFAYCAKEAPDRPVPKAVREYAAVLRDGDAWSFMFFYGITFGGFVGLASSLTLYFHDQYGMPAVTAGSWTAVCVLAGSFMRPVGGFVADRVGGIYVLSVLYIVTATTLGMLSLGMPDVWMAIAALIVSLAALGMGNGAIFQLLPQRFRSEFGMMTGLVGMAGGLGGFILASGLGYSKQLTNSYQTGFLGFALLALVALLGLTRIKGRWRTTWGTAVLGSVRI